MPEILRISVRPRAKCPGLSPQRFRRRGVKDQVGAMRAGGRRGTYGIRATNRMRRRRRMSEFDLEPETPLPGPLMRFVQDQRVAFLIVGGINTVVGMGLFVAFSLTIGEVVDRRFGRVAGALATVVIAHVLSVLFAFVMHRRFVFRVQGHILRDLTRFWSVYLAAGAINLVALPVLVELGLQRIPAQAMIVASTMILSYFGHRHFSFRRSPSDKLGGKAQR